mmetsp:Transcript_19915/g.34339  ORF Transcript_19915/g.34339 Transcript_19915/m.34339 type:complete len:249 (+) Transcript_19915:840-1586(+)
MVQKERLLLTAATAMPGPLPTASPRPCIGSLAALANLAAVPTLCSTPIRLPLTCLGYHTTRTCRMLTPKLLSTNSTSKLRRPNSHQRSTSLRSARGQGFHLITSSVAIQQQLDHGGPATSCCLTDGYSPHQVQARARQQPCCSISGGLQGGAFMAAVRRQLQQLKSCWQGSRMAGDQGCQQGCTWWPAPALSSVAEGPLPWALDPALVCHCFTRLRPTGRLACRRTGLGVRSGTGFSRHSPNDRQWGL